ncbi:Na+/H+ antiporter NhaA [Mesorhizobium sp. ES1-1]|nr:Na+/H+ antiporter NhaA [Mesorhizobium sp. ES1-1]
MCGSVLILVRTGLADLPARASWTQTFGRPLLCGMDFSGNLLIGFLAFEDPALRDRAKIGIIMGWVVADLAGFLILKTDGLS